MKVKPMKQSILFLSWLALFGISVPIAVADVTQTSEIVTGGGTQITYKMIVSPAAESVPAFKHRLTVLPHQTIAANAATNYLRSFGESGISRPLKIAVDEFGIELYEWALLEVADSEVPIEKLRQVCRYFDGYIDNHIRRATLCRTCDWGLAEEDLTGIQAIGFLLPSVQQSRQISRILALRTRLAVIDGRYDDAIDHLRMNYQLGRNFGKMKFLVSGLVGMAVVSIANHGMINLIGAKDSPNMYWALAELPSPLFDIRETFRLEMSIGLRLLPELKDIETAQYSDAQWTRLLQETTQTLNRVQQMVSSTSSAGDLSSHNTNQWATAAIAFISYPSAKKRLIQTGMDEKQIQKMPVAQVLLIDMKREYQRLSDEAEKSIYLDFADSKKANRRAEDNLPKNISDINFGGMLAAQLLPAIEEVNAAHLRVESQRCVLQVIEALRMHLAENKKFPKTLGDITVVPVPRNPATGLSFVYQLEGDKAILEIPFSDGYTSLSYRYEIEAAK